MKSTSFSVNKERYTESQFDDLITELRLKYADNVSNMVQLRIQYDKEQNVRFSDSLSARIEQDNTRMIILQQLDSKFNKSWDNLTEVLTNPNSKLQLQMWDDPVEITGIDKEDGVFTLYWDERMSSIEIEKTDIREIVESSDEMTIKTLDSVFKLIVKSTS